MPYYGLIPLRAYAMKLPDFFSISSLLIIDSVLKETITTKTLPTLPSHAFSPQKTINFIAALDKIVISNKGRQ
ncbi:hypothetical protein J1N35_010015 [Gossypium stocksii]|uniref:Uncharacterized protein n=1 Tax=Gossypium stocksii TaxID=47602 RepID=A0A9D3W0B7_9ROSI|nr:hypothetical protein J1N35_010015 [Gossypium stocksii]